MSPRFFRFIAGGAVAISLFGATSVAGASSLTTVQVQAIIGLLQSFGADQNVIAKVSATLNGQTMSSTTDNITGSGIAVPGNVCLRISHNFRMRQTDDTTDGDVSRLQQFLGISPTGFFGTQTLQAVEDFQESHGIANRGEDGFGSVGPKTRALLGCLNSNQINGTTEIHHNDGLGTTTEVHRNSGSSTSTIEDSSSHGGNSSNAGSDN